MQGRLGYDPSVRVPTPPTGTLGATRPLPGTNLQVLPIQQICTGRARRKKQNKASFFLNPPSLSTYIILFFIVDFVATANVFRAICLGPNARKSVVLLSEGKKLPHFRKSSCEEKKIN